MNLQITSLLLRCNIRFAAVHSHSRVQMQQSSAETLFRRSGSRRKTKRDAALAGDEIRSYTPDGSTSEPIGYTAALAHFGPCCSPNSRSARCNATKALRAFATWSLLLSK